MNSVTVILSTTGDHALANHDHCFYDIDPDGAVTIYDDKELRPVAFYPEWLGVNGSHLENCEQ